jgi:hypothetical protein
MSTEKTSVRIADPSRIVRLVLDRSDNDLTITMSLLPQGASSTIEVRCRGASDVRFRGERTELKEIVLLQVEDISSSGWEGARYRVKDYEEEFISFVCREIDPPLSR